MLRNFCSDSAPAHVRDFYMARLYRSPAATAAAAPAQTSSTAPSEGATPDYHALPNQQHPQQPHQQHQYAANPDSPRSLPLPLPGNPNLSPPVTASSHSMQPTPVRPRPRGGDGRFVPRADEYNTSNNRYSKVCGWCGTSNTSQWRVGPTTGSVEMGTLCNACGINYRRALAKTPDGVLDLDKLAQQMGHTRLSIQKALKRQRKLSATPTQMKRTRADAAAGGMSRSALKLGIAQSMLDDGVGATTSSVTMWEEQSCHQGSPHGVDPNATHARAKTGRELGGGSGGSGNGSSAARDSGSGSGSSRFGAARDGVAQRATMTATSPRIAASSSAPHASRDVVPLALSVGLPVPRAFSAAPPPQPLQSLSVTSGGARRSAPLPIPGRGGNGGVTDSVGAGESPSARRVGSWKSGTDSMTFSPAQSERSVPSRLPPFQSFLGSLERQPGVL